MTEEEVLLWSRLRRDFDHKFRRQVPLGPYIVDFVCFEARLAIEVDGRQHGYGGADRVRDEYLAGLGFRVLRFWNRDVRRELPFVLATIEDAVLSPSP